MRDNLTLFGTIEAGDDTLLDVLDDHPGRVTLSLTPVLCDQLEAMRGEAGDRYLRFLREISPGLWITDTRHPDSPYVSAFFHDSLLPDDVSSAMLPSRNIIFEFELKESPEGNGNNFQATDIKVVDMQR